MFCLRFKKLSDLPAHAATVAATAAALAACDPDPFVWRTSVSAVVAAASSPRYLCSCGRSRGCLSGSCPVGTALVGRPVVLRVVFVVVVVVRQKLSLGVGDQTIAKHILQTQQSFTDLFYHRYNLINQSPFFKSK